MTTEPTEFTIDEIVETWKTEKTVFVLTTLGSYECADGTNAGGYFAYKFNNTEGNESQFRQALSTHTTPIYKFKINIEEFRTKFKSHLSGIPFEEIKPYLY